MYSELKFGKISGCGLHLNTKDITIHANELDKPDYVLDQFSYKDSTICGSLINRIKEYYVNISMKFFIEHEALYICISAVNTRLQESLMYKTELVLRDKKNFCIPDFNVAVMYGKKLYQILDEEL
jgi:hypothetical protein